MTSRPPRPLLVVRDDGDGPEAVPPVRADGRAGVALTRVGERFLQVSGVFGGQRHRGEGDVPGDGAVGRLRDEGHGQRPGLPEGVDDIGLRAVGEPLVGEGRRDGLPHGLRVGVVLRTDHHLTLHGPEGTSRSLLRWIT